MTLSSRWRRLFLASLALAALGSLAAPGGAVAAPGNTAVSPARFAVIIGVNRGIDRDMAALRFADDDAAAYLDLFRALGARTYLLSRFDENTRRVHTQAAAEARDPRRAELTRALEQVAADVALARQRGLPTVLYFVYAGHGNVENGRGYLALEDGRLFGADLEQLALDPVRADQTHFIIDACYSFFLALGRGPSDERRESHEFSALGGLGARPNVGLLLSTSSARESHEWSEFQAGVFSHEIRSGLLGAADADRDGQVTYREIAAFVERANAPIANDRFRPDVYIKELASRSPLLDLRSGLERRLELNGERAGHYLLEDAAGVRLADFHYARGQRLNLVRPMRSGPLFLRRVGADEMEEYVLEPSRPVLRFEDLKGQAVAVRPRGAANEAFRQLFSLPFSVEVVNAFVPREATVEVRSSAVASDGARTSWRHRIGLGLVGLGVGAAAGATWAVFSALEQKDRATPTQADTFGANDAIERRNNWARALYGVSGAALTGAAVLLLWPRLTRSERGAPAVGLAPRAEGGAILEWSRPF